MSLVRANDIYESIVSKEHCKGCEFYGFEDVGKVLIPFCLKRYFGKKCVKAVAEDV